MNRHETTASGASGPTGTDPLRIEATRKRIRATLGGAFVLDSTSVRLVWENRHYPQYYVPRDDLLATLEPAGRFEPPSGFGEAERFDLVVDEGRRSPGAAWVHDGIDELAGLVRIAWDAVDQWFEEDEPVIVHPRSPHVRVDALRSSREIRIEIDGVEVARSTRPTILFETGLPPRFYLPATDVRLDLLTPSELHTRCPYKGEASYHHATVGDTVHENVVWHYPSPLFESLPVAGMLCFYDERVDVWIDGVRPGMPSAEGS